MSESHGAVLLALIIVLVVVVAAIGMAVYRLAGCLRHLAHTDMYGLPIVTSGCPMPDVKPPRPSSDD